MIICYNFSVRISREMPPFKVSNYNSVRHFQRECKENGRNLITSPDKCKEFRRNLYTNGGIGPPSAAATPNVRGAAAIESMPRARLNTLVTVFFSGSAAAVLHIAPLRPF